jgi:hypothetical protein
VKPTFGATTDEGLVILTKSGEGSPEAGVAVNVAIPEIPAWALRVAVAGVKVSAAGEGGGAGGGLAPPPPPPHALKSASPHAHKTGANVTLVLIPLVFTWTLPVIVFIRSSKDCAAAFRRPAQFS